MPGVAVSYGMDKDENRISIDLTPLKVSLGKLAIRHRRTLDQAAETAGMKPEELYNQIENPPELGPGPKETPENTQ